MTVLRDLHRLWSHICFIQETHFLASKTPSFKDASFPFSYNTPSPDTKSKVISMLIHRSVPRTLEAGWSDHSGRMLFLKGTIGTQKCTLAKVYSPNQGQISFLEGALEHLDRFAEGILLIGGDFNTVLNPSIDASSSAPHITFTKLNRIKRLLHRYQLVDIWCFLNTEGRDF